PRETGSGRGPPWRGSSRADEMPPAASGAAPCSRHGPRVEDALDNVADRLRGFEPALLENELQALLEKRHQRNARHAIKTEIVQRRSPCNVGRREIGRDELVPLERGEAVGKRVKQLCSLRILGTLRE